MPVWFITGTSRGIGLELTKQLAANEVNTIVASCRSPASAIQLSELASKHKNVHIVALDVLKKETMRDAFEKTQAIVGLNGVDYLINNAGIAHADTAADVMPDDLGLAFRTHVIGMLLVFRTFLPLVRAGARKVVVNVSSGLGSIGCDLGARYSSYGIAKAGLNMLTYKMEKQYPELIIFPFTPGHIKTDLGGPTAPLDLEFAVAKHIPLIESATKETHAGRFLDLNGNVLPW
ncbi:NAD(P)-binding protein [Auricularia subglabra TFB-10046 SS5]|nr:NAD(P)-binding protein [Auricularia subglabra TFB-10046 SS5]